MVSFWFEILNVHNLRWVETWGLYGGFKFHFNKHTLTKFVNTWGFSQRSSLCAAAVSLKEPCVFLTTGGATEKRFHQ